MLTILDTKEGRDHMLSAFLLPSRSFQVEFFFSLLIYFLSELCTDT